MPIGTIDRRGVVTITYDANFDPLIVEGKRLLPCRTCGEIQVFDANYCVVSCVCVKCEKLAPNFENQVDNYERNAHTCVGGESE